MQLQVKDCTKHVFFRLSSFLSLNEWVTLNKKDAFVNFSQCISYDYEILLQHLLILIYYENKKSFFSERRTVVTKQHRPSLTSIV